eukprot:1781905-Lingulodinium_polyedra.AAC.1
MEGCYPTVKCTAHHWCAYNVGALDGKPSGSVYYCLSNMDMQAHSCACPPGTTHGIAWGNRSSYGQQTGAGSLKLQHEA